MLKGLSKVFLELVKFFDKAYEDMSIEELCKVPVSAISGTRAVWLGRILPSCLKAKTGRSCEKP